MARTGFFHHVGSFLLFAATVLLIITDISAPVINDISILRVRLSNATEAHDTAVTFGTFGYCLVNTPATTARGTVESLDFCSRKQIGYDPVKVLEAALGGTDLAFSDSAANSARDLTKVMVLHPVATGLAFIAFLLALGAGVIGSFLGSLVALVAFAVSLAVLATDAAGFAIIRDHVNNTGDDSAGAQAKFGVALWTTLAATACLLLGTVVVFFTCCSARLHTQRGMAKGNGFNAPLRRPRYM